MRFKSQPTARHVVSRCSPVTNQSQVSNLMRADVDSDYWYLTIIPEYILMPWHSTGLNHGADRDTSEVRVVRLRPSNLGRINATQTHHERCSDHVVYIVSSLQSLLSIENKM
jgi:hypothetical protein